jgi:hypothetical protein
LKGDITLEIAILVTLDIFFLLLTALGVTFDRRITRLERRARKERRDAEPRPDGQARLEAEAERRFTEGVASILSYDFDAGAKERGE